jgi:hypothetical protein
MASKTGKKPTDRVRDEAFHLAQTLAEAGDLLEGGIHEAPPAVVEALLPRLRELAQEVVLLEHDLDAAVQTGALAALLKLRQDRGWRKPKDEDD